jgi:transposase
MKQIRKLIEIHLGDPNASIRAIAHATRVSRPVVKGYLDRLASHPLKADELTLMNDESLRNHLELSSSKAIETAPNVTLKNWLDDNICELSKVGMTRRLLHERYLEKFATGLKYSQFCFLLGQQYQTPESSSLFEHKAGDKLFIDFTGKKLNWKDSSGTLHTEEIFLSVMGASSYFFATPTFNQKQDSLAQALQDAFLFYGGVTKAVVPDCLKSAVLHNDGYEPEHNPLFQRLLEHYGTISLPARPNHPKDKPLVEGAVNLVYRQILARIEREVFIDRPAMLTWWRNALVKINTTPFQKLPGSRQSRFDMIDKPVLKPLPVSAFSLETILRQTVTTTGMIYVPDDKTSYSVPCSLKDKKVEILVSPDKVEIWNENQRCATHERQPSAGIAIIQEHRPPEHRWYAERSTDEQIRAFSLTGIHIGSWARRIVSLSSHEDQAWQVLEGLKRLVTQYPDRIDTACRLAQKKEVTTLKALKKIIATDEDIIFMEDERLTPEFLFHENIRGAEYYDEAAVQS